MTKEFIGIIGKIPDTHYFYKDSEITIIILNQLDYKLIQKICNNKILINSELYIWLAQNDKLGVLLDLITKFNLKDQKILHYITDYTIFTKLINIKLIDDSLINSVLKNENIEIMKFLLKNMKSKDMSENVKYACFIGNTEMFDLLTKHKFKPDSELLYKSISSGNLEMVRKVINLGVNYLEENCKCLKKALGNQEIFDWLLEYILSKKHKVNYTEVLNEACLQNQNEEIEKLLKLDPNLKVHSGTLNWLAKKEQFETIKLLLRFKKISNEHLLNMHNCNKKLINIIFV